MCQVLPLYPDIRQVDVLYRRQIIVFLHLGDLGPAKLEEGDLRDHISDALLVFVDLLVMLAELMNKPASFLRKEGVCFDQKRLQRFQVLYEMPLFV